MPTPSCPLERGVERGVGKLVCVAWCASNHLKAGVLVVGPFWPFVASAETCVSNPHCSVNEHEMIRCAANTFRYRFSASWLRSSVVSVLYSLISVSNPMDYIDIN